MVAGGTHVVPLERKELVRERVEHFLRERVLALTNAGDERKPASLPRESAPLPIANEPPAREA